jgi:hypothetical protein
MWRSRPGVPAPRAISPATICANAKSQAGHRPPGACSAHFLSPKGARRCGHFAQVQRVLAQRICRHQARSWGCAAKCRLTLRSAGRPRRAADSCLETCVGPVEIGILRGHGLVDLPDGIGSQAPPKTVTPRAEVTDRGRHLNALTATYVAGHRQALQQPIRERPMIPEGRQASGCRISTHHLGDRQTAQVVLSMATGRTRWAGHVER